MILATMVGDRFWAMSDILMSAPGARPEARANLPLHYDPVRLASESHTLVGTAQKSIILWERILLQWAGNQVVAEAVARAVLEALEAGQGVDMGAILDDPQLGLSTRDDVSLIVHADLPDGRLLRLQVNTHTADDGGTVYAGTGSYNFVEDVETSLTQRGLADHKPSDRWYARVALALAEEFYFKDPLEHAYGGWHEVVGRLPWGGFGKAPYLVKFWTVESGTIVSGPVFTSWYVDQHLCILGATGGHGPGERHKLVVVPAWHQPRIDDVTALARFDQPYLQVHVVNQDGVMKFFWTRNPWPEGFGVDVADGKIRITVGPEVVAKILCEDERAATLSRSSMQEF